MASGLGKPPKDTQPKQPIGLTQVGGLPDRKAPALKPPLCRPPFSKCAGGFPEIPQNPFQGSARGSPFQLPTCLCETTVASVLEPKRHTATDTRQKQTTELRRPLLRQTLEIRRTSMSVFSPALCLNLENGIIFHKRNIYVKVSWVSRFKIKSKMFLKFLSLDFYYGKDRQN